MPQVRVARCLRALPGLLATLLLLGTSLAGCTRIGTPAQEGVLLVAAFPEPGTVVLPDGQRADGLAHDLLDGLARRLGVPVQVRSVESFEELETLVREGRVHVGAFLNNAPPPPGIVFSRSLNSTPLWVVQHADSVGPTSLFDLAGRPVHVVFGSPAAAALAALPASQQPQIVTVHGRSQADLLQQLAAREISYAATDELAMRVAANFAPDLQPAVQLFGERQFALAFPVQGDTELRRQSDIYIDDMIANGTVQRLYDRYYGHIQRLGPALIERFLSDRQTLLPRYRALFQKAQEATGLDWRLLAALSYQESKWDPLATSYTNVRGLMMLTEDTADLLAVDNRLDPAQSITGGARYLLWLMDQLPEHTAMPDRLWLALAAYNLGMGHLNGARAIARSLHKDADSWFEMKTVLPLMMRPQYYERLKSGRARGGEAVILVENVRNLFAILARLEAPWIAPLTADEARLGTPPRGTLPQPMRSSPPT